MQKSHTVIEVAIMKKVCLQKKEMKNKKEKEKSESSIYHYLLSRLNHYYAYVRTIIGVQNDRAVHQGHCKNLCQ